MPVVINGTTGITSPGETVTGNLSVNQSTGGFLTTDGAAQTNIQLNTTTAGAKNWRMTNEGNAGRLRFLGTDGTTTVFPMFFNPNGQVTMPSQPAFRVNKSTSTTAFVEVVYNVENLDIGNNFNTSTGRFTAPVSGTYYFSFFGVPQTGTLINLSLYANGGAAGFWTNNGSTSNDASCSCSAVLQLNANDYVSVFLVGGTMRTSNGDNNGFMGYLIG
jgi:hypothetical protein